MDLGISNRHIFNNDGIFWASYAFSVRANFLDFIWLLQYLNAVCGGRKKSSPAQSQCRFIIIIIKAWDKNIITHTYGKKSKSHHVKTSGTGSFSWTVAWSKDESDYLSASISESSSLVVGWFTKGSNWYGRIGALESNSASEISLRSLSNSISMLLLKTANAYRSIFGFLPIWRHTAKSKGGHSPS